MNHTIDSPLARKGGGGYTKTIKPTTKRTYKYNRRQYRKPPSITIYLQKWLHQLFISSNNNNNYRLWIGLCMGLCCFIGNSLAGFACLSNPCVFGVCIDDLNSTYSCYCIDGYTGVQCQTNWDECWSSPCQNGGTCIDGVAQYNCSCQEGFSGQDCEENVDECLSNPCQNGGICIDKDNGYMCTCSPGYLGAHCEVDVAVCETGNGERCHNGGECIEGKGLEFTCNCAAGWTGVYCDSDIDECESSPCQNGAVCVDKLAHYLCACPTGYTGTNCEEEIMVCDDSPCSNNALCLMEEGLPVCYCVPDYHGEKCEFQYDECQIMPPRCVNGGTCIDGIDEFTCSCPTGLIGLFCECLLLENGDMDCNYTAPETSSIMYTTEWDTTASQQYTTKTSIPTDDKFYSNVPNVTADISSTTTIQIPTTMSTDTIETSTQFNTLFTTTISNAFYTSLATLSTMFTDTTTTSSSSSSSSSSSTIDASIPTQSTMVTSTETEPATITDSISIAKTTSTIESKEIFPPIDYTTTTISSSDLITTSATMSTTLTPYFTDNPQSTISSQIPLTTTGTSIGGDDILKTSTIVDTTISPTWPTVTTSTFESLDTTTMGRTDNFTGMPDCTKIPCFNGGTCAGTSEGAKCVCRFDRQGPLCEQPVIIHRAAFGGDSYLSHRIHPITSSPPKMPPTQQQKPSTTTTSSNNEDGRRLENVLSMQIEVKARTRAIDGLILLAVAQGIKGNHYMALFLHKGLLQFQFSCGLQTMLLSELEIPVNTGDEILIQVELAFTRNYTHCNASLRVNETLAMSGDQPTWLNLIPYEYQNLNAIQNTWLHLGGTPQAPIGLINGIAGGQGFTGCLYSLKINGKTRDIHSDALDGFEITECGSLACLSNPCRNGAICIEINEDNGQNDDDDDNNNNDTNRPSIEIYTKMMMENDSNNNKQHNQETRTLMTKTRTKISDKWKCKCPTGYMGSTCEISVCDNNPCQYGATCVTFPGSGYLCLCPFGKHGHYCEHNLEIAQPQFSGSVNGLSSYVAYPIPLPLEYSIELNFKIFPTTISQISLLAFLGQSGFHDEKSDHLAISFIQGYIMLTWNLGSGPRRIFTQKPIDFREDGIRTAIDIKVGRIGREAWLSVDGKVNISGKAPGSLTRMDVVPVLFLGGHDIANFSTLPHDLPYHSGFQGCIFDVHLKAGLVTVPLQITRGVRGRGVGQCATRECHRHACQHEGACLHHGATFSCICQDGWYGPLCSQSQNPCDSSNNKCAAGAMCVPLVNGYECDCPLGKTGRHCDQEIQSLSDVAMTGRRSYLVLRPPDSSVYHPSTAENEIQKFRSITVSNASTSQILAQYKQASGHPIAMRFLKPNYEVSNVTVTSPPLMVSAPAANQLHHRVQYFSIEFQIRPLSERGLLFYFGEIQKNWGRSFGFLSLSLQGGVVEFRIASPNDHIQIVRSVRMLAIGEWHRIKITQSGRRLTLWVEGSAAAALAASAEILIDKDALMYIGGLPDLSRLPFNAISGFPVPFRGCIRQMTINGDRLILNETNILSSQNINDCDGTPCGGDSCESGGQCWLDESLQPHCKCPDHLKGDRCEYQESCKFVKCKNNGKCSLRGQCDCQNGWGGFYCEIATTKSSTPSFRGNSYLVVSSPRIPIKDKRKGTNNHGPVVTVRSKEMLSISLNFSTIYDDGLLFWNSKQNDKFLGLGLQGGHIKMASDFLDNPHTIDIPTGGFVADGGWHNIQIDLDIKTISLKLDGRPIFSVNKKIIDLKAIINNGDGVQQDNESNGVSGTLDDLYYIGGFPNNESIANRTNNKFSKPFTGCLQEISFGNDITSRINDFGKYIGENIGSCDLYDDFSNV